MPDQTAHDAVRDALDRDVPYLGPGGREQRVENVLAALGIPPDAKADDVSAGYVLLQAVHAGHLRLVGDASTPAVRAAIAHNREADHA